MQVQVDLLRLEVAKEADEILQAATQAIHGPRSDDIDFLAGDRTQQGVELRAILPALRTADAVVDEFGGNRPSVAFDRRAQLAPLILGCLAVGGDAGVERGRTSMRWWT